MRTSEAIDQLSAALSQAQGVMQNPSRNRTVKVRSERGEYEFAYATLDHILDAVREPLAANGLAVLQVVDEEWTADQEPCGLYVLTRLTHSSGQWVESRLPVKAQGRTWRDREGNMQRAEPSNQEVGSAITYARRYALTAVLGIAADEDDDANTADGNHVEGRDRAPGAKPQPSATARGSAKRGNPAPAVAAPSMTSARPQPVAEQPAQDAPAEPPAEPPAETLPAQPAAAQQTIALGQPEPKVSQEMAAKILSTFNLAKHATSKEQAFAAASRANGDQVVKLADVKPERADAVLKALSVLAAPAMQEV